MSNKKLREDAHFAIRKLVAAATALRRECAHFFMAL